NLWQQSKAALELWMQIRSMAYALAQLLALQLWQSFPLMAIAPWRKMGSWWRPFAWQRQEGWQAL
ncbi:MAG: hypothetical protein ABTS22_13355, partial [Accumulibacter sp.]